MCVCVCVIADITLTKEVKTCCVLIWRILNTGQKVHLARLLKSGYSGEIWQQKHSLSHDKSGLSIA